jgi:hypothetical protein
MRGFVTRVAAQRIGGGRPSSPRALLAASAVGTAAAVLTYRVLRSS